MQQLSPQARRSRRCGRGQRHGEVLARCGSPTAAVRSKTHCTGLSTAARNGPVEHRPVVDDVHVDDRRGAQPGRPARRPAARCRPARAPRRRAAGRRARPGRRRSSTAPSVPSRVVSTQPVAVPAQRGHPTPVRTAAPAASSAARAGVAVQLAERHPRPADVGGAGGGEQPGAEDRRGQRQRRAGGRGVERGDADEVPQRRRPPARHWPWAASQSPKDRWSAAGSAGSTRRSASAARATPQPVGRAASAGSGAARRPGAAGAGRPLRRSRGRAARHRAAAGPPGWRAGPAGPPGRARRAGRAAPGTSVQQRRNTCWPVSTTSGRRGLPGERAWSARPAGAGLQQHDVVARGRPGRARR